ncbi:hypothetical protein PLESTB_000859900 [Pleodorina starrii]|uniref:Serine aminopeptidase S33 domain-containing protein n=1 Tax=Pleodorina starrii TaxID=330485 RepID=A0A9W6F2P6_9CHLO|nr:hypothetical protein PLESTM_001434100 [Pleodorina starrii]GLC54403.1 hypothetical protein PLESTB_000859900 [Pleodorina starrii]
MMKAWSVPAGDSLARGLCPDFDRGPDDLDPILDVLDVESLPLRWLNLDATGAAALAYRHYLPSGLAAPLPQQPPRPSPPTPPATPAAAAPAVPSPRTVSPSLDVCVLYCNGLKSHMSGVKVRRALNVAAAAGCEFLCFDYSGFGASRSGPFESCGLQDWVEDAAVLLAHVVRARRVVIVGSSIGGWVALRLAQMHRQHQQQQQQQRQQLAACEPATQQPATQPGSAPTVSSSSSGSPAATATIGERNTAAAGFTAAAPTATPAATATNTCEHLPTTPATAAISGLLLIAPAVDLSEVRWAAMTEPQQRAVLYDGALVLIGSPYQMNGGDAVGVSYFAQGRRNLLHSPTARNEPLRPGVSYSGPLTVPESLRLLLSDCAQGQLPTSAAQLPLTAGKSDAVALSAAAAVAAAAAPPPPPPPPPLAPPATRTAAKASLPTAAGASTGPCEGAAISVVDVPVVILHGSEDEVVPLQHSEALLRALSNMSAAAATPATANPAAATGSSSTTTTTTTTTTSGMGTAPIATTTAADAFDAVRPPRSQPAGSGAASLVVLTGGDHRLSCPAGLRALQQALMGLLRGGVAAATGPTEPSGPGVGGGGAGGGSADG